jgi:hypothetical protein
MGVGHGHAVDPHADGHTDNDHSDDSPASPPPPSLPPVLSTSGAAEADSVMDPLVDLSPLPPSSLTAPSDGISVNAPPQGVV